MTRWYWRFLPEFRAEETELIISRTIDAPVSGWATVTTTELVNVTTFSDAEPVLMGIPSASAISFRLSGSARGLRAPTPPGTFAALVNNHRCPWCDTIQDNQVTKCPNCGGPQ